MKSAASSDFPPIRRTTYTPDSKSHTLLSRPRCRTSLASTLIGPRWTCLMPAMILPLVAWILAGEFFFYCLLTIRVSVAVAVSVAVSMRNFPFRIPALSHFPQPTHGSAFIPSSLHHLIHSQNRASTKLGIHRLCARPLSMHEIRWGRSILGKVYLEKLVQQYPHQLSQTQMDNFLRKAGPTR